jgi:plasmid maintenance system killer protein
MMVRFRNAWRRVFVVEDARPRHISSDLTSRLFRELQMIDDATTDQDCECHPAITSRSCAANRPGAFRFVSTASDGWSSGEMAATA